MKEDPRLLFSDWLAHRVFNIRCPAGRAPAHRFTFIYEQSPVLEGQGERAQADPNPAAILPPTAVSMHGR